MHAPTRRQFLLTSAAAGSSAVLYGRTLNNIGVQLYTVRDVLPKKPLETLKAIEQIGYREVEVVADSIPAIWPSLKQTSLKPVSVHLDPNLFTKNQAGLPPALEDMKKHGFQYVVCPWIDPKDRGGADMIRRLGDSLNKAGAEVHKAGMQLAYHNHAFEFAPSGNGILLDILMQSTDPKLVNLELDIMWAHVGGVSPVDLLHKYGNRVALMHLKNVAPSVKTQYNENVPKSAFREVGNGVIDIPPVLKAATEAGVKHFFVEQDETPGDPIASLRKSYQYLSKLNF